MGEEKAFGLTADEVVRIKDSIAGWTETNSPVKKKADGGNFCSALKSGSKMLREDKTFVEIFNVQRQQG